MRRSPGRGWLVVLALFGCAEEPADDCAAGTEGCACQEGQCFGELFCDASAGVEESVCRALRADECRTIDAEPFCSGPNEYTECVPDGAGLGTLVAWDCDEWCAEQGVEHFGYSDRCDLEPGTDRATCWCGDRPGVADWSSCTACEAGAGCSGDQLCVSDCGALDDLSCWACLMDGYCARRCETLLDCPEPADSGASVVCQFNVCLQDPAP